MKTQVLRGSKQEIADRLVQIDGEVCEAIVFVNEPALSSPGLRECDIGNIFAEMRPFMVDVQDVDGSREAIYSRMEGE